MTVYNEWERRSELADLRDEEWRERQREIADHLTTLAECDPWSQVSEFVETEEEQAF